MWDCRRGLGRNRRSFQWTRTSCDVKVSSVTVLNAESKAIVGPDFIAHFISLPKFEESLAPIWDIIGAGGTRKRSTIELTKGAQVHCWKFDCFPNRDTISYTIIVAINWDHKNEKRMQVEWSRWIYTHLLITRMHQLLSFLICVINITNIQCANVVFMLHKSLALKRMQNWENNQQNKLED
jgi:hypothetical protein